MSENICLLCKNTLNSAKCSIDQEHTHYSNILLRTLLENVFANNVILNSQSDVCVDCVNLLNELDFAETTYKRIRQKVLDYLGTSDGDINSKSNVYCQTDVFLENVLEFDIQGKTKLLNYELESSIPNSEKLNGKPRKKYKSRVSVRNIALKKVTVTDLKEQDNVVNSNTPVENVQNLPQETINIITNPALVKDDTPQQINNSSFNNEDSFGDTTSEASDNQDNFPKFPKNNRGRKKKHPGVLKPYKCTSCPKTWKTLGELKSHLSSHSDARPFICEMCGQAYKHQTAFDVHVGMHNGIYPFTCTYCNKSFTQKGALQRHLPIHTGETPYQCDLCGKRFVHHTSFNIHQLSHTGQKNYKCAECGLALLSGSHLKRHMRVHTGERNYVCPYCGKKFAERYNLVSHQKLHENPGSVTGLKRNHSCHICGTVFHRRLRLDEHLAKDHQKAPAQRIFSNNELESLWSTKYNGVKMDVPETSY